MNQKVFVIFLFLINVLIGLVFLYSAYSKLYPIEPFELTFVEMKVANWVTAPFMARLFISIEFFIGWMLISNLHVRFFSKMAIGILFVFSMYLIGIILVRGNKGNCECFGTHLFMTPLQALMKNVLMMFFLWLVSVYHRGFQWSKGIYWVVMSVALVSLILPHVLNHVEWSYSEQYLTQKENEYKLGLDTLIKYARIHKPPSSIKEGKHIIAFMSLTCPHCRIAAKKIRLMKENNPQLPFYFVLNGDEKDLKAFFEDTRAEHIPYSMLLGKSFISMAGLRMPAIYLVQNDTVVKKIDYISLQQSELEKWLNDVSTSKR
mgnify:CR=1 FL=1